MVTIENGAFKFVGTASHQVPDTKDNVSSLEGLSSMAKASLQSNLASIQKSRQTLMRPIKSTPFIGL